MLAVVKRAVSGEEHPLPANPFAASMSHTETDAAPSPRDSSNDSVEISHYSTPPTILSGVQSAEPSEPDAAAPQKDAKPDAAAVSAAVAAAAANATAAAATPDEPRRKSVRARSSVATYSDTVLSGHAVHTRKSYRDEREFALAAATRASLAATALADGDAPPATPSPRHARAKDPAPVSAKTSPLRKRSILRITRRASARVGRFSLGAASAAKAVASASAVLEKGRDAFDGVKERVSRSSILSRKRLRGEEDTPSRKRARFNATTPDEDEEAEKRAKAKQRPKKPWVEKGLYSGQDEDEVKTTGHPNRRKSNNRKELRKKPAFPLPMYTGALLLEHGRDFKLPFSILNPLPRDQSPKDWKNLSKNRFIGDAVATWKKSDHTLMSSCQCTPEGGCGEDCLNRSMRYECNDDSCNIGPEHCTNRGFAELKWRGKNKNASRNPQKRESNMWGEGIEVMKTEDRGYGVRSMRAFEPGQVIVEYTGEIITPDEGDRRMNEDYKGKTDFYLMTFHDGLIIDATRGSICRFVNHSCSPNCRVEKWIVDGEPRMALFAGDEGIETGEELTYDYNFDPFDEKSTQTCLCGSENCRGVLGPKTLENSKIQKATAAVSKMLKGAKRKIKASVSRRNLNDSPRKRRKANKTVSTPSPKKQRRNIAPAVPPQSTKLKLQQHQSRNERAIRRAEAGIITKSRRGRVLSARTRTKDRAQRYGQAARQRRQTAAEPKPRAVLHPRPKAKLSSSARAAAEAAATARDASRSSTGAMRGSLKRKSAGMEGATGPIKAVRRSLASTAPSSSRKKRAGKKTVDPWAIPVSSDEEDESDSDSDEEQNYPTPSTPGSRPAADDESTAQSGVSDSDSDDESAAPARHSSRPSKPSPKAREIAALAKPRRRPRPAAIPRTAAASRPVAPPPRTTTTSSRRGGGNPRARRAAAARATASGVGAVPERSKAAAAAATTLKGGVVKPRKPQARTRVSLSLGVGALLAAAAASTSAGGNAFATPPSSAVVDSRMRDEDDDDEDDDDDDEDGDDEADDGASPRRASVRAAKPSPKARENLAARARWAAAGGRRGFAG